jgi:hypothetical protein
MLESLGLLCEEQAGFRKRYGTTDHIFNLKCLIDLYLFRRKKLYCAFIDYRKAFDSVDRILLWQKLLLLVAFTFNFQVSQYKYIALRAD